jgi:hypothetical protein
MFLLKTVLNVFTYAYIYRLRRQIKKFNGSSAGKFYKTTFVGCANIGLQIKLCMWAGMCDDLHVWHCMAHAVEASI